MRKQSLGIVLLFILMVAAGCSMSFGKDFPAPAADSIKIGVATKADLQKMFGEPGQVGIEDGLPTWTYAYVSKKPDQELSKQLQIKFNQQGIVTSYSYTSNFPEDMKRFK